jgi:hypothetical protein
VHDVQTQTISPIDVLHTYGKVAVKAHEKTNCVTELLLPEAEEWATSEVNLKGPLAGIPVSLKDTIQVKGFDVSVGYASKSLKPYQEDGVIVKILKDAGKYIPQDMLKMLSNNEIFRRNSLRQNGAARDAPQLRVCQWTLGHLSQSPLA